MKKNMGSDRKKPNQPALALVNRKAPSMKINKPAGINRNLPLNRNIRPVIAKRGKTIYAPR